MLKSVFPFIIAIIFSFGALADETDSISQKPLPYDTNYIISYRDWIHITAVAVSKQTGLSLANINENRDISFSTNNPVSFGFAFDYEWVTFEYTHSFNGFDLTDASKGESKAQSLRFGLTGRKFRMSTFYRGTKGFHFVNIEDWVSDWFNENKKYPFLDDLESQILAFSLYYTFNHRKYSNTAALWQLDRQIKSAGSPVVGFQSNAELIKAGSPIITYDSIADKYLNISKAEYLKIGLTGGYMHTFSIKKLFYIHAAIMQGFLYSFGNAEYYDREDKVDISTLGISLYLRLTMGYNGKKWFGGFFFVGDSFITDVLSDSYEITSYNYVRMYVGYRFPFKKRPWMKKIYL